MNHYSIYSISTGYFSGVVITTESDHLLKNIPEGCSCILGKYDHLSQRVDLLTDQVVDYQPPQPSPSHEWDIATKRWLYVPTTLEACHSSRRLAYPSLNDLADALYWQARGDGAPMNDYLARCDSVKAMFKKP